MSKTAEKLIRLIVRKVKKSDEKRLEKIPLGKNVREYADLPYVSDGSMFHTLDVYRPDNEDFLPVIVDFHGGGWVYGVKEINKPFCYSMARRGFVVVNVNYRLAPEADLRDMVHDCFAAVNFAAEIVGKYGGDKNNLFLAGDSAGGHLACLTAAVCSCGEWREYYGAPPLAVPVRAVWSMCGVVTDVLLNSRVFPARTVKKMLSGEKNVGERLSRAYIGQLPEEVVLPPLFLSDCERDFTYSDQLRLQEELERRGLTFRTCFWDKSHRNIGHVYNVAYPYLYESVQTNDWAARFFREIAQNRTLSDSSSEKRRILSSYVKLINQ